MAVHCPECGFANPEGANYCQKCGAYLGGPKEAGDDPTTMTYRADETGEMTPVDIDEPGEVVVRGPHVMPGYWGLPEETAAVFADGWFRSGDAARVDEDGYVFIVDRIKDMIISGGENIYPAEIEDQLLAHPDIAECAVIGIPDDKWGEVPRAVVVPREGRALDADEVLASLAGRLAKYKIPKSVVIAEELPRTASGKLLKARVRKRYGTDS
jgi:fatty-acyl-CoA synthase